MGAVRYLAGCGLLAAWVAPLAVGAVALRRRFAPGRTGARARLAEATLVLAALLGTAQLLGAVGALRRLPLVAGCVALGGLAVLLASRARPRESRGVPLPPVGLAGGVVTAAVCTLLAVQWGVQASKVLDTGVYNGDSLTYHLLYAVEFFRTGSTTHLVLNAPGAGVSFHPVDSELLQGLAMLAFGRDWLAPLLNLGWLALALLAAWCLGRRAGVAPATLTAAALVLVPPLMSQRQPGSAMSDTALIAFVLAMSAFLLDAWHDPGDRFALALAGAAGGLALASKLNAVPLVAAATLAVPVLAGSGRRLRATLTWAAPLVVTGSFWYLRNLARVGSPVPTVHLGPLPVSHQPLVERYGYPVARYLTDGHVIGHWILPGLRFSLGPLWFVLLAAAVAGVLLTLRRGAPPALRGLAFVAAVGAVGYAVTPTTAYGPAGEPILFALNLRYLLPPLAVALPLVPLGLPPRRPWGPAVLGGLAVTALVTAFSWGRWHAFPTGHPGRAAAVAAVALAAAGAAWLLARRRSVPLTAGLAALAAVAGLAGGAALARHYEAHRYAAEGGGFAAAYHWASDVHDARIGIDGFGGAYGLTGADLSNVVRYVGAVGPHDSLRDFTDCADYVRAVDAGGYRYLVFAPAPTLGPLRPPPMATWVAASHRARLVLHSGAVLVYEVTAPLRPTLCGAVEARAGGAPAAG